MQLYPPCALGRQADPVEPSSLRFLCNPVNIPMVYYFRRVLNGCATRCLHAAYNAAGSRADGRELPL